MKAGRFIHLIIVIIFAVSTTFAQDAGKKKSPSGPRRQLATIVFAGIGGAVLGLSTLSFYGRPQDQLVNIAVGFAVGVIVGTTYVTFKAATSREYYDIPSEKMGALDIQPSWSLAPQYFKNTPQFTANAHDYYGAVFTKSF